MVASTVCLWLGLSDGWGWVMLKTLCNKRWRQRCRQGLVFFFLFFDINWLWQELARVPKNYTMQRPKHSACKPLGEGIYKMHPDHNIANHCVGKFPKCHFPEQFIFTGSLPCEHYSIYTEILTSPCECYSTHTEILTSMYCWPLPLARQETK